MRKKIILICNVCQSRNYTLTKSVEQNVRIEMNKYCSNCKTHTLHKETK